MRLLKIATVYPGVLRQLALPNDSENTYDRLHDAITLLRFGWSDYHTKELRELGHWAEEFYWTEPTISAWAQCHRIRASGPERDMEVIRSLVDEKQPDVVVFQDMYSLDRRIRSLVRAATPDVKLIGWRAYSTPDVSDLDDVDMVLSSSPNLIRRLEAAGIKAAFLAHGFASDLASLASSERNVSFGFMGSLAIPQGPLAKRYQSIETLMATTPLTVWGDVTRTNPGGSLQESLHGLLYKLSTTLRRLGVGGGVMQSIPGLRAVADWSIDPRANPIDEQFPQRMHTPLFGLDYFSMLGNTRIALNIHIEEGRDAMNMRDFEATGMGALLLTDDTTEIDAFFKRDEEIVVYSSLKDVPEIVEDLLMDEQKRAAIAAAGRARTLKDHTYQDRARRLADLVESVLA